MLAHLFGICPAPCRFIQSLDDDFAHYFWLVRVGKFLACEFLDLLMRDRQLKVLTLALQQPIVTSSLLRRRAWTAIISLNRARVFVSLGESRDGAPLTACGTLS